MTKQIKGFENYIISSDGQVFNAKSSVVKKQMSNHSGNGYLYVDLYCNGNRKRAYVHRLVAESFIPNIDGKPYVNHIDGNPINNDVTNLEWCTPKENVIHAAKVLGVLPQYHTANEARKRPVACYDYVSGAMIAEYPSIRNAELRTGIPSSNIVAQLKGRQSHTRYMTWRYI